MNERAAALLVAAVALSGCDIDQTRAGELPDLDVDVDAEAGQLPEYDVDWMDVDVGTTERTIEVPKVVVVMEEETVTVPVIDVRMPDAGEVEERTLTVAPTVPHAGYEVEIQEVRANRGRVYVIATLEEADPTATTQAVQVSDRVVLNAPDVDVRTYIIGSKPSGLDNGQYTFLPSMSALPSEVTDGRQLYAAS